MPYGAESEEHLYKLIKKCFCDEQLIEFYASETKEEPYEKLLRMPLAEILTTAEMILAYDLAALRKEILDQKLYKKLYKDKATILHFLVIFSSENFRTYDRISRHLKERGPALDLTTIKDKNSETPLDYIKTEIKEHSNTEEHHAHRELNNHVLSTLQTHQQRFKSKPLTPSARTIVLHRPKPVRFIAQTIERKPPPKPPDTSRKIGFLQKIQNEKEEKDSNLQAEIIACYLQKEGNLHLKNFRGWKNWNMLHIMATVPKAELEKYFLFWLDLARTVLAGNPDLGLQKDALGRDSYSIAKMERNTEIYKSLIDKALAPKPELVLEQASHKPALEEMQIQVLLDFANEAKDLLHKTYGPRRWNALHMIASVSHAEQTKYFKKIIEYLLSHHKDLLSEKDSEGNLPSNIAPGLIPDVFKMSSEPIAAELKKPSLALIF